MSEEKKALEKPAAAKAVVAKPIVPSPQQPLDNKAFSIAYDSEKKLYFVVTIPFNLVGQSGPVVYGNGYKSVYEALDTFKIGAAKAGIFDAKGTG